jgi:glycosyltransferase involved in cell wall biosynthesis
MQLADAPVLTEVDKNETAKVNPAGYRPPARVLYLTDLLPTGKFGSMEEQIFELSKAFHQRGGLFLPVFGNPLSAAVSEKYQAAALPVAGLNLHSFSVRKLVTLLQLIRRNAITTVHWNFYSPINSFVWLLSIFAPGLTHCLTDHTSRELPLRKPATGAKRIIKKFLFRRYKKVWCISDFIVHCLEHNGTWSNLGRCTYFINTDRFKPDESVRMKLRQELAADGKFIVLFVGHVIKVKGGDVAIKAMRSVPDSVHLWFLGDGADLPAIKELAEELSVRDRVHFLGHQNHVERFMQAADCFICPSLWGEATGLVNLESQAAGLPIIASRIGGIPEFVNHGVTGFLFTPGDDHELAKYIRTLAEDVALYSRLRSGARSMMLEKHSIGRRIDEYLKSYD